MNTLFLGLSQISWCFRKWTLNLWSKTLDVQKLQKNIRFKAKLFLNKKLLSWYYSHIHSYINYANLTWGSTYLPNLKKCIVNRSLSFVLSIAKERMNIQRQLCRSNKILNEYRLNSHNILKHKLFFWKIQCINPQSLINVLIAYRINWLVFQNKPCFEKQVC